MKFREQQSKRLLEKLQNLPKEGIKKVENLTDIAMRLSKPSFEDVWNNPEDDDAFPLERAG